MTTILDLHKAHRELGPSLPAEAWQAAGALLVIGQSRDDQGMDTWTWPRAAEGELGYSRRTLGGYAGGVGPESIRRGIRCLERLGMVKTRHRSWHSPQYTLIPQAWLELAEQAKKRPAELLARVEAMLRDEKRSTTVRTLSHMIARVAAGVNRTVQRAAELAAATAARVTPASSSPAGVTAWPLWVEEWAKRNKVQPAQAWSAVEPVLILLEPGRLPAGLGQLGQEVLKRWKLRGFPSGMELGAEIGLLEAGLKAGLTAFNRVAGRMAKGGGRASLLRSPAYDDLVKAATAWRAEQSAAPLPVGAKVSASGLTGAQALDLALAEQGLCPETATEEQLLALSSRVDELLSGQGPAPPS